MNRKRILFVRGVQENYGSKQSDTFFGILNTFPNYDYDLLEPNYNNLESLESAISYINGKYYDFIIGHSAGGFLAMYFSNYTNLRTILINPMIIPTLSKNITNLESKHFLEEIRIKNESNLDRLENLYSLVILGMKDRVIKYTDFLNSVHINYSDKILLTNDHHKIEDYKLLNIILE